MLFRDGPSLYEAGLPYVGNQPGEQNVGSITVYISDDVSLGGQFYLFEVSLHRTLSLETKGLLQAALVKETRGKGRGG